MPRETLTASGIAAANASASSQPWLLLMEISHEDMTTLRFVADTEDVISDGQSYTAMELESNMPDEKADELPQVRARISNIDQTLIAELREITPQTKARAEVLVKVVLASDPDNVQVGPFNFELITFSADAGSIEMTLGFENLLRAKYPGHTFNPAQWPNLF